ncbi:uncharacterized protein MAM_03336 [Metarhizium album ARSEF 1941]|uniref:Uncharacterized protein n=1 Tax=Metarhizium album (strain ARSEF 1941) TaxID=1081103 RepID=A0A0B2WZ80_METAS|nr:uncharacterized protein MAM_03336 [Metarhizium album ARSEF 1941]KHN98874.1 hypothetical protein MAM_03336 [Metarhizium album ARSEF 1941]
MGQDKDGKPPDAAPAGSNEPPQTSLTRDDDADDPSPGLVWPLCASEPVESSESQVQSPYDSRHEEAGLKGDLDTKPVAEVQGEGSKGTGTASTRNEQRHNAEDFQEYHDRIHNAMNHCAPDLYHLARDTEPLYLSPRDFVLPANLCTYVSKFVSTIAGSVGMNNLNRAALDAQRDECGAAQKPERLALTQETLMNYIAKPLEMLCIYIQTWQLRVVDHENGPAADLGLDAAVPTPGEIELEAFAELTSQYNKLKLAYSHLLMEVRAQRAEPSPPKRRPSWDWQQATRVCAACGSKFERHVKDKGEPKEKARMEVPAEDDQSIASHPLLSVSRTEVGAPTASAEVLEETAEEWTDDLATFDEEQARLLQQPRYVSPTGFSVISAAEAQEDPDILEPTPSYPRAPSPTQFLNTTSPWHADAEAQARSHHVPEDRCSVASILGKYGPPQEDLSRSSSPLRRKQYLEDMLHRKCEEHERLREIYEEMADRYEGMTRIYERSAKRYNILTRRYESLTERHEEMKARFDRDRQIHDTVTAVYVTKAVDVDWTRNSSRSRSGSNGNGIRSMSPPVSPRGTVYPMTPPPSLDTTETGRRVNVEPRARVSAPGRAPNIPKFEQGPRAAVRRPRVELQTKSPEAEASMVCDSHTVPRTGQSLSFSGFVENQCQSWVTMYDFLWSFIDAIPQPSVPLPGADGSSLPMNRNAEPGIPWSAFFNVLTHAVLVFGIQTWIACAEERNTWLYANNIKPPTLLSSYARGERSSWPGLHGGLFTGAELSMLLTLMLLNSRHVLGLLGRVVRAFDLANRQSMRVVVFGAVVFMFCKYGGQRSPQ